MKDFTTPCAVVENCDEMFDKYNNDEKVLSPHPLRERVIFVNEHSEFTKMGVGSKNYRHKAELSTFVTNLFSSKRIAFTLAEVLITLGIIGVVAVLTLPTVINKIQKRNLEIAFKKTYSVLAQVTQRINYDNGGTFIGAVDDNSQTSLVQLFLKYFKTAKVCNQNNSKDCGASIDATHNAIVLPDGISMTLMNVSSNCTSNLEMKTNINCFRIRVDTNGSKKPNKVGQDIFDFFVTQKGLIPRGAPETTEPSAPNSFGAAYYVLQYGLN